MKQRRLREFGIMVVREASKCSHLAAPSVLRTPKFVNALAYGPTVISTEFVDQCLEKDRLIDASSFPLMDKEAEKRYNFTLSDSTSRAKLNKNKLLRGYHICCCESIRGGFDTFKSIASSNGADCILFRGRLAFPSSFRQDDDDDQEAGRNEVYLLSNATPDQTKVWPRFQQMVEDIGKVARIVRVDWLLDIAMSQKLLAAEAYELDENSVKTVE